MVVPMSNPQAFVYHTKVEFADTDSAGVAHFTSILKMVERAEHAFLDAQGITVIERSHGRTGALVFGWPRVDVRFRFRRPIVFGDQVAVELSVTDLGEKSIGYSAKVVLGDGEVAAEGEMINACAGSDGDGRLQAIEIPEALRGILRQHLVVD